MSLRTDLEEAIADLTRVKARLDAGESIEGVTLGEVSTTLTTTKRALLRLSPSTGGSRRPSAPRSSLMSDTLGVLADGFGLGESFRR